MEIFSHQKLITVICCLSGVLYAQEAEETETAEAAPFHEGAADYLGAEEPARQPGEIPAIFRDDAMLDENYENQELGINVYTAPSIRKIFDQLDSLPSIPEKEVLRSRRETLPMDSGSLALEMGYLMADGFIAVRSGHMNDVKPIALEMSRYGKAIGVGDRMDAHSAVLLETAEKGQLEEFKNRMSATQNDVNAELAALRDPDLSHLIALGGWARALSASAAAVLANYSEAAANSLFYEDAPQYFTEVLQGLDPYTARKLPVKELTAAMQKITAVMSRKGEGAASAQLVEELKRAVDEFSTHAVGAKNGH